MASCSARKLRGRFGPRATGGSRPAAVRVALGLALSTGGCAMPAPPPPEPAEQPAPAPAPAPAPEPEIYLRAEEERTEWLEREVARLRADLGQAEQALVAAESGLRDTHTRADAVAAIAESRIGLERVADRASWREHEVAEARAKLDEADRQVELAHFGSAMFFASRAQRIVRTLEHEVEEAEADASTRFIRAARVNLRAGPSTEHRVLRVLVESTPVFPERRQGAWVLVRSVSGDIGWVHGSLLGDS